MVKNLSRVGADRITAARGAAPFRHLDDLQRRAALNRRDMEALAAADALAGLAGNRHQSRWQALGVEPTLPLFDDLHFEEAQPMLRPPSEGENIVGDYASVGLSLRRHPLALLRTRLEHLHLQPASALRDLSHGATVRTGGLVINRQRPGTATGVVFMTLEDETGYINVVIWSTLFNRQRRIAVSARLLALSGEVQREGEVIHVIAKRLYDHTDLLGALPTHSRDFQ
jgi:error-prone DNA polymerase